MFCGLSKLIIMEIINGSFKSNNCNSDGHLKPKVQHPSWKLAEKTLKWSRLTCAFQRGRQHNRLQKGTFVLLRDTSAATLGLERVFIRVTQPGVTVNRYVRENFTVSPQRRKHWSFDVQRFDIQSSSQLVPFDMITIVFVTYVPMLDFWLFFSFHQL